MESRAGKDTQHAFMCTLNDRYTKKVVKETDRGVKNLGFKYGFVDTPSAYIGDCPCSQNGQSKLETLQSQAMWFMAMSFQNPDVYDAIVICNVKSEPKVKLD